MSDKEKSENILYLECEAGISGDMLVAALLDTGADETVLRRVLDGIPAKGYEIIISRVKKAGIDCCDFNVKLDAEHENHDHDMEYLHGHGQEEHHHEHEDGGHHHGQVGGEYHHHHGQGDGHRHHVHRGMQEITDIINHTQMTEGARSVALKIFDILAHAEAKAHAVPVEQVHFHEVGAIDSIVDVIAAAVCLDNLGVREVIIPKLAEGKGTVRCQHGILPIPVPAVVNIVAESGLNLEIMDVKGEFVTPTGAAIAAAIKTSDKLPEQFRIRKVGIGAGKRSYERPSILRAMLVEPIDADLTDEDVIYKLESNIDDCTGEMLGYAMECLLAAGARDVHYHPVYMKKNRPGWQLNVICAKKDIDKLEEIIFRETTTIGIRRFRVDRSTLVRRITTVDTPYGKADVKVCTLPGGAKRYYPEYESVVRLCREQGVPYQEIYRLVMDSIDSD